MKAFIKLFLVLMVFNSVCYAGGEVYSRVCNYNQVRGVKVHHPGGMLLTACLNRTMIEDSYETSEGTYCIAGFVDGVVSDSQDGPDTKVCLRESSLGEVYETASEHTCSFGYGANDTRSYRNGRAIKFCVKGRNL